MLCSLTLIFHEFILSRANHWYVIQLFNAIHCFSSCHKCWRVHVYMSRFLSMRWILSGASLWSECLICTFFWKNVPICWWMLFIKCMLWCFSFVGHLDDYGETRQFQQLWPELSHIIRSTFYKLPYVLSRLCLSVSEHVSFCYLQAILHPSQARVLTVRENARLQGFPDYYQMDGPIKQR
jgi:hypothetical protein